MDLWIKSQDGEQMIKTNKISIYRQEVFFDDPIVLCRGIKANNEVVGEYKTEERMLEVYNEILYKKKNITETDCLYIMPKE